MFQKQLSDNEQTELTRINNTIAGLIMDARVYLVNHLGELPAINMAELYQVIKPSELKIIVKELKGVSPEDPGLALTFLETALDFILDNPKQIREAVKSIFGSINKVIEMRK